DTIQSASGTAITLDADASPRDDDYNGMRLYIDDEFRDILDYDGTTKVATVSGTYTTPPSPSDPYDIKIAFLSVMSIFEFRDTIKGQVQDKHNRRELSYADDGDALEIGTVNYVDTTGGAPTFTVPGQAYKFLGAWIEIVDSEGNFDTNPVTLDFHEFDAFEGVEDVDFVCDEKNVKYKFRFIDIPFGWTVEKSYITSYGEMYQINDPANTITIGAKDTWYTIDGMSAGDLVDFTFANGSELIPDADGEYDLDYNVCWTDGTGTVYKFRVAVNGATIEKTQSCGRKGNAID
ncbi:unnamed protein product, partial [marine sediment metagenome]